jgi:hypothetical protein
MEMSAFYFLYCDQKQPEKDLCQGLIEASRTVLASIESRLQAKKIGKLPLCVLFATYVALGVVIIRAQILTLTIEVKPQMLPDSTKVQQMARSLEKTSLGYARWIRDHTGEGLTVEARRMFEVDNAFGSTARLIDQMLLTQNQPSGAARGVTT